METKPFPKQRFVKMNDNNLDLKSGYIINKKYSFTSNYLEWLLALYHRSLWFKAKIAPPYHSNTGLSKRLRVAGEMGKVTGEVF